MGILIKSLKDLCSFIILIVGMAVLTSFLLFSGMYIFEYLISLGAHEILATTAGFLIPLFFVCLLCNLKVKYFD